MKYYIGIDLGGTNIAAGIVSEDGRVICKGSVPTNKGRTAKEIVKDMADLSYSLVKESQIPMSQIPSIGIGVPGTANRITERVEYANNLGFHDEPIMDMLREYFPDKKILFGNDAKVAAWAEFTAGSGRGYQSMVLVTLGTGIGGGIVLNGKVLEGVNFAAGELGHMTIDIHGKTCNCGRKGCFEAYASATALIEQTKEAMKANSDSLLWELCEHNLDYVEGKTVFLGVKRKDMTAQRILDSYIHYLSCGLLNIINMLQPEVICIGGGISNGGDMLLEPLQKIINQEDYARFSEKRTKLVIAQLGNDAGIIGAALQEN